MALRMRTERIHNKATRACEPARRRVPGLRWRHGRLADQRSAHLVGTGGNVRPNPYNERPRVVGPGLFKKECQDHAPTLTGTCPLYHR